MQIDGTMFLVPDLKLAAPFLHPSDPWLPIVIGAL